MRGTRYIKEYYQYKLPRICWEQMTISYFAKEYFLYFHLWTWNIFPAIAWPMNIDKSLTLSGNSYWIMNTKDSIQIFIRRGFKQNEAFLNIYHQAEKPINWKSIAANGRLWWAWTLKMQHWVEEFCFAKPSLLVTLITISILLLLSWHKFGYIVTWPSLLIGRDTH